jgi:hypothetical protein
MGLRLREILMRNYVTLYDRAYLAKGLALYESLQKHSSEPFTLYILALDDFTRKYLEQYKGTAPSNLAILDWNFMPKDIPDKPVPYNFFLLASEVTLALMKHLRKPVTYLDSDIYFFNDPKVIYDTIGSREVAIVPHRFPPHDYNRLSPNGLYNVSLVYFSNSQRGIETLMWWRDQCRAKCDAESCGDQKYLDQFVDHLTLKLCILDNVGIGAGPWNAYMYDVQEGPALNLQPLIFYHFHEYRNRNQLTGYPVTENQRKYIYDPYIEVIENFQSHIDKKAQEWYA